MTRDEFNSLVKRLEQYAKCRLTIYKLRVATLAGLGYTYIFLVLAVLVALVFRLGWSILSDPSASGGAIRVEVFLIAFAAIIVRALCVRFPPPQGLRLRRTDAPKLFELVDELTAVLDSPRFHHILLTNEFNAAVIQWRRLGILGFRENFLMLGVPLMEGLSSEQFRAVLAHELGHLSGNHGRFAAWIYQLRQTWNRLVESLQRQRHIGSFVFYRFINWYAPFFDAYSFVLARAHEYEADQCAAELTSPQCAAEALIQVQLRARALDEKFWRPLDRQIQELADPPGSIFESMFATLRAGVAKPDSIRWMRYALTVTTNTLDTHPSLQDRLLALGFHVEPNEVVAEVISQETAASVYFGENERRIADRLKEEWRKATAKHWRQRHKELQKAQGRLSQLESNAKTAPLPVAEAWERIRLAGVLRGDDSALGLLRQFVIDHPDQADANFQLGRLLLEREDSAGIAFLDKAVAAEPGTAVAGCEVIDHFLQQRGRMEEAAQYKKRAEEHYDLLVEAQRERAAVSARDNFEPHGLSPEALEGLRAQLARYDGVDTAFLARKSVRLLPQKPLFVLVVVMAGIWYKYTSRSKDQLFAQRLATEVKLNSHRFFVLVVPWRGHRLAAKVRRIPGSQVLSR